MTLQLPASIPFRMSFFPPEDPPNGAMRGVMPEPAHIESVAFTRSGVGQIVRAHVPEQGGEHEYTYTIPANTAACFSFTHSGHFRLIPTYAEGAADNSSNGEGSARDHGETLLGIAGGNNARETRVPHRLAHERTVTWTVRYVEGGDPNAPYTVQIELGGC